MKARTRYKKTFVIDRTTWRCGGNERGEGGALGTGDTSLLNAQGYMCCLGQIALQCGFSKKAIRNKSEPNDVEGGKISEFLRHKIKEDDGSGDFDIVNTTLADKAIGINDDKDLTLAAREKSLTALFAKHKYRLRFEGKVKKIKEREEVEG